MENPSSGWPRLGWRIVVVGVGTGLLAGLLGIGGGVVAIFGLVAWARFSQHRAHATSLAAIPLVALAGMLVFRAAGHVHVLAAATLTLGSLVGAVIGARIMAGLQETTLRRAFGVLMLAVGIRLLL